MYIISTAVPYINVLMVMLVFKSVHITSPDILLNVSLQLSTWSSSTSPSLCLYGRTGRPSSLILPILPKRYNNTFLKKTSPRYPLVGNPLLKSDFFFPTPVLPAQGWEGALWEGREARVPAGDPVESRHQSASVHPHRSWRYVCLCVWMWICK